MRNSLRRPWLLLVSPRSRPAVVTNHGFFVIIVDGGCFVGAAGLCCSVFPRLGSFFVPLASVFCLLGSSHALLVVWFGVRATINKSMVSLS